MKDEQKTETYTKTTKTTKDKPKNEAETEQKTTVVDKVPAAAQRAVHFRTLLAIIGVAAACGLSVRVCARLCMVLALCAALVHLSRLSLALVWPLARIPHRLPHPTLFTLRVLSWGS